MCPSRAGYGAHEHVDAAQRLAFLRHNLTDTIAEERGWSTKWAMGWAGLAAAQLVAAPLVKSEDKRTDLYVGGIGASAGLLPTFVVRPRALAYTELAASSDNSCDTLIATEDALDHAARDERFMHSWLSHAGSALFSVGIGMVLGLGYHHWLPAAGSVAFGLTMGELMIRTRTSRAVEAMERYRGGELSARAADEDVEVPRISFLWARDFTGIGLSASF